MAKRKRKREHAEFYHDGVRVSLHVLQINELHEARKEGFLTETEVMGILGISQSTVQRWRKAGALDSRRVDKTWLFSGESVLQALKERR